MNSEESLRRLLNLEEAWKIAKINFNHHEEMVRSLPRFPDGIRSHLPGFAVFHTTFMIQRNAPGGNMIIFQNPVEVHSREPRIRCSDHGKKTVELSWEAKGYRFHLHFEALTLEMCWEMAVSTVARIVDRNNDSVWRIFEHYVDEARK